MRVENMISKNGNKVANQFIISINGKGTFFQSYKSIIAGKTPNGIILDKNYWNYSVTTSRYRTQFLGETTKETQAKIDSGEYQLVDLNNED